MNILITGGNGYVAKSLYNGLKNSHTISTITRKDLDLTNYELLKNYFLNNERFDVVIHTAISGGSRLSLDSFSVLDSNLQMYYNLLQNRNYYGRLISFGSGAEIHAKDTVYGLSKCIISDSIKTKDDFYNLRIYAVFDENELDTRFIKSNIKRYIKNESMVIHQNKKMDFFYMQDLIKLVSYYIEEPNPPKQIDCKYKTEYTLVDISDMINDLSENKVNCVIENTISSNDYIGSHTQLPIQYIGLKQGIINTYNIIKKELT
jgi:GDP-L-fucose synthase